MHDAIDHDKGLASAIASELLGTSHELRIDVIRMAQLLAASDSARYYTENMDLVPNSHSTLPF